MMLEQLSTADLIKQIMVLSKKVEDLETIQKDPVRLVQTPNSPQDTYIFNVSKKLAEKFVIYPQLSTGGDHTFSVMRAGDYWLHCGCPKNIQVEKFLDSLKVPYTIFVHEDGDINHYLSQFDY